MSVVPAPTIEDNFRLAVRHVIPVAIWNEQEIRWRTNPDPAKSQGKAAREKDLVFKDFPGVKDTVTIRVFQNDDSALRALLESI